MDARVAVAALDKAFAEHFREIYAEMARGVIANGASLDDVAHGPIGTIFRDKFASARLAYDYARKHIDDLGGTL